MRAKGIESHPVLVNLDSAYTLSTPPTMAQLNHAITWLPEFDLFADTTAAVAPFGTLPYREYGKPAVIVGGAGKALRAVPVLQPGALSMAVSNQCLARCDRPDRRRHADDGDGDGGTGTAAAGAPGPVDRHRRRRGRQLQALGQTGQGTYTFAPPDGFGSTYEVRAEFNLEPQHEILEGDAFAPVLGPILLARPGDLLLGPRNPATLSDKEPTPCFAGRQVEELSLRLPDDRKPLRLPAEPADRHRGVHLHVPLGVRRSDRDGPSRAGLADRRTAVPGRAASRGRGGVARDPPRSAGAGSFSISRSARGSVGAQDPWGCMHSFGGTGSVTKRSRHGPKRRAKSPPPPPP